MLSKNFNNKKCAPKSVFFNEKKMRKIRMISDIENWLWSLILALFDSSPLIQNSKFNNFFWVCWFFCKNLSNFVPPAWKLHNPYCQKGQHSCWRSWIIEIFYWNCRPGPSNRLCQQIKPYPTGWQHPLIN